MNQVVVLILANGQMLKERRVQFQGSYSDTASLVTAALEETKADLASMFEASSASQIAALQKELEELKNEQDTPPADPGSNDGGVQSPSTNTRKRRKAPAK